MLMLQCRSSACAPVPICQALMLQLLYHFNYLNTQLLAAPRSVKHATAGRGDPVLPPVLMPAMSTLLPQVSPSCQPSPPVLTLISSHASLSFAEALVLGTFKHHAAICIRVRV